MNKEEAIKDIRTVFAKDFADKIIKALEQQSCTDTIRRQDVLDFIDKMPSELTEDGRRMIRRRTLEEYISDTLPPVNPQPKTGHWIYIRNSEVNGLKIVECSECGKRTYGSGKYCPNCGTKMEENIKQCCNPFPCPYIGKDKPCEECNCYR